MFGFTKSEKSTAFKAEAVAPAPTLPCPPVIIRQENIVAVKALLADLNPQAIKDFISQQGRFSYTPVTGDYPFGTNREAPVFARFWEYDGMKPCCKVLCMMNKAGSFTLITKAELRLLTLYAGDTERSLQPAALLSVPNTNGGVAISVTGDNKVFKGAVYLDEADATQLMTSQYDEAMRIKSHFKGHGPTCPTCPTGLEAKTIAAKYADMKP